MEFIFFISGTFIGSFLNVLAERLPKGKSVVFGRSRCDNCKRQILWYDLFPILSYLILKGKCRSCKAKLSYQYPLSEVSTGLMFSVIYAYIIGNYGATSDGLINLIFLLILISGLWVIFVSDLKYRIIPDEIIIVLIGAILGKYLMEGTIIITPFISAVILSGFFLFLYLFTRGKGMGFGDVKFAFFIGLLLGWPGSLIAFYLSFLTGAVFSLILVVRGKKKMKSTIAFGPFLVFATVISYFWGTRIWNLVMRYMGMT